MTELVGKSDAIVIGKCVSKQVRIAGRLIETDYEVEVGESLKGKIYSPGQRFTLTVLGGKSEKPPITQFVELQTAMVPDEQVALFLKMPSENVKPEVRAKVPASSRLLTTPRVIGMNEGKFSIFKDATDGKMKVARINMESYGYVHDDDQLTRIIKAVAKHEANITSGPVVSLGSGLATTPAGKELVDQAAKATGKNVADTVENLMKHKHADGAHEIVSKRLAIPVQDLQEFKNQIIELSE